MSDATAPGSRAHPVEPGAATTARTLAVVGQLQVALHVLVAGLLGLSLWRIVDGLRGGERLWALALAVGFGLVYVAGTVWARHRETTRQGRLGWLVVVTPAWALLVVHVPDAAYLAFPLYFVHLAVLGTRGGSVGVAVVALVGVTAIGLHRGWSVPGVVGPVVAALVAVGIGVGVRALQRESLARRAVIEELVATRARLAEQERDAGRESERARLAGEIHDTVAQGLSSIAMLLHAVERADPEHPAVDRLRLARRTATENLAETRRFIAELKPAALEGTTVCGALERLAARMREEHPGLDVDVCSRGSAGGRAGVAYEPPADVAAALVRIAGEAAVNAVTHGRPDSVLIDLTCDDEGARLVVVDDGDGFDPSASRARSSFGLEGMRRRVEGLGGRIVVDSAPGRGTTVSVAIPRAVPTTPRPTPTGDDPEEPTLA